MQFSELSIENLIAPAAFPCACGKVHKTPLKFVKIGAGAVNALPEALRVMGTKKPFVVCDPNTLRAAGERVYTVLKSAGIDFVPFTFAREEIEPDEWAVGSIAMALDPSCDCLLAVGSGVINDLCKVVGHATGKPSLVVGTAPSMDGYASNSSSMIVNGVKTTLYNRVPEAILADTDIMKNAPMRMLRAGLGDMLAKYISICEWRISHLVTGEYYCEEVAKLVRRSLKKCVDAAAGLPNRDSAAVGAIAEGLILSGMAMGFAEVSRPASGLEHYFSHMWEMMALERGHKSDLHGIQVGVGTKLTMQIYQKILRLTPDRARAMAVTENFDAAAWEAQVRRIFGKTAPQILQIEEKTHKNDPQKHAARVERLIGHWDEVLSIIREELPSYDFITGVMRAAGLPMTPAEINVSLADTRDALLGARDIRDKYLSCSMLWDLGYLDEFVRDIEAEANQI